MTQEEITTTMPDVPLREYFEAQLRAIDKAVEKAESQLNKRLEGMNEFRESLRDQSAKFITKSEYDFAHKTLDDKIRALEMLGVKTAFFVSVGTSIAVGVIIFIVGHFIVKP